MRRLVTSKYWRTRRADVAALAGLGLFFVAFFPRELCGGRYPLAGDAFFYSYPLRTVAWDMIRHGQLPLWTPYVLSGYPLLSMAQLGLGYPLTWSYLFLPGNVAEQVYVLAPFLLAPVLTYLYLRQLQRTPLAALLGALTYGYGGMMASPLANNGLMPNAVMWLPLLLIAIERARTRRFVPCLLWATGAYTMSVLTGYGQGFLYVGLIAGAYALMLVLTIRAQTGDAALGAWRARLTSARQWQPLFVAGGAALLAAGVAAFQILETARVVRRSVRSDLSYQIFTQGSFQPVTLWQSFTTPLFYVIDMTAYVPPLALVLVFVAILAHVFMRRARDPRVFFWLAVALTAIVLMLGAFTPFYRIVYYLPLLNRFRVPSRHTFEWTFAAGVLAAYGWDALAPLLRRQRAARPRPPARTFYAALALLALSVLIGVLWWLKAATLHNTGNPGWPHPITVYRCWKGAFALLTLATLWRASLIAQPRRRYGLLLATVLVLCYVEPSLLIARWWGGFAAARFSAVSDATRYLQQSPPEQNRVYTRVALTEQFETPPRFDCANISAVAGLHNVAGYEPLILERYSRALGGVGLDSVLRLSAPSPDPSLLGARSHVLDILNTSFVISYANLAVIPQPGVADGNIFTDMRVPGEVLPQTTGTLTTAPVECDTLLLVTSLANSVAVPQGTTVAQVRIHTTSQGIIERELRAGVETAEWAHDRPDVRTQIKHELAPVFDSEQTGGAHSFPAHRYKALLKFDKPVLVTKVEITNVTQAAPLGIYSATLSNAGSPAAMALGDRPADTWQPVYQQRETLILRNTRALPRAWLVAEAEAVDGEEALRRIRGESASAFEPRRTALLEVRPEELPQLPGGAVAPESEAHITRYTPNRLQIETSAPTQTVLVLSEIFYPGWEARVDGRPTPILLTDYLLRGMALPAGQHKVEMRYTAPAARNGALISVLTLGLIAGLAVYARRKRAGQAEVRDGDATA